MNQKQLKLMAEGRVKAKELYGLVLKIDEDTEIYADKYQYVLVKGYNKTYFGTLEDLFVDLFKEEVKGKLVRSRKKDMEKIIEIHQEVAKWLEKIFSGIEDSKLPH